MNIYFKDKLREICVESNVEFILYETRSPGAHLYYIGSG